MNFRLIFQKRKKLSGGHKKVSTNFSFAYIQVFSMMPRGAARSRAAARCALCAAHGGCFSVLDIHRHPTFMLLLNLFDCWVKPSSWWWEKKKLGFQAIEITKQARHDCALAATQRCSHRPARSLKWQWGLPHDTARNPTPVLCSPL